MAWTNIKNLEISTTDLNIMFTFYHEKCNAYKNNVKKAVAINL